MPEELQSLLERIQKEGVDKAEAQAAEILARARKDAAAIVSAAEQKALEFARKAESEAEAFRERAEKSLQHAARDVVLTVGDAVTATMKTMVERSVDEALTIDVLKDMLAKIVSAYLDGKDPDKRIEVLVSPKDLRQLQDFLMSRFRAAVDRGLEMKSDNQIVSGFRVSVKNGNLYHDFSGEAIAQAVCGLIQPRLAEIVRSAMASKAPGRSNKT